jgi:hypothetical protein
MPKAHSLVSANKRVLRAALVSIEQSAGQIKSVATVLQGSTTGLGLEGARSSFYRWREGRSLPDVDVFARFLDAASRRAWLQGLSAAEKQFVAAILAEGTRRGAIKAPVRSTEETVLAEVADVAKRLGALADRVASETDGKISRKRALERLLKDVRERLGVRA